ncbi:MAG: AAA family ATPase, partial [Planctomycetaceae bacterium]|nr:AAA family ATPase [Planctomycetaceae bacterium]
MPAPHVMIIGSDAKLTGELRAVFDSLPRWDPIVHLVGETRRAGETARSRRPQLALVEMNGRSASLRTLAEELQAASPETQLVAVFDPNGFPPDVPESAVLIEALRSGVSDFLRRPVSRHDVEQLFDRLGDARPKLASHRGKVVSFISNKGGVGKSTLAVNTAVGLAQSYPEKVLLIDGSLQMGVCAAMLDLKPATTLIDAVRERDRLDETLIRQLATPHKSGLDLLAAPADAIEGSEVDDEVISRILTLSRRAYDFVIVDTFPLFDRVVMAVLDLSDASFVVLDNVVPTVLGTAKLLEVIEGLGYPAEKFAVVVNRYLRAAGHPRIEDVADRLQREISHAIPYDKKLLLSANTGQPFV